MLVYSLVCLNVSLELSACVSVGEGNGGAKAKERQRLILDFVDMVTSFMACKHHAWRVGYEYYCPRSPRPFCCSLALHALDVSTTRELLVYTIEYLVVFVRLLLPATITFIVDVLALHDIVRCFQ